MRRWALLFLEANMRLHFISPLEDASNWFEYIRKLWVICGSHKESCSDDRRLKWRDRSEIVNAVASESGRCFSSKKLARKRKFAVRLSPLLDMV